MTRKNEEFAIDNGPSKLDLMLSLFDTDMGKRIVKFYQKRDAEGKHGFLVYDVQITSARRRNPARLRRAPSCPGQKRASETPDSLRNSACPSRPDRRA